VLKKIVEALRDLVTEVNLDCTAEGISLQAMDSSHVALVTFHLRAADFEEFHCEQHHTLGLSLGNWLKVIKCAENDDRVTLRTDNSGSTLTFIFEGKSDEKVSEFQLNLLTIDSEHLGIPEQEYSAVITMSSSQFARICREMSQLSDTLIIDVDKQRVKFSVSGDAGEGAVTLKHKDTGNDKTIIEVAERVCMSFALRYLNLFNKAATLGELLYLSLSPDLPLVVHFEFELGEMKYFLAPKISDEA